MSRTLKTMSRRIIVKIGSQVLCDQAGALNQEILSNLVGQLAVLAVGDWEVLVVSSGAVAAGMGLADGNVHQISDPVVRKQVMAATGQVRLMECYREFFTQKRLQVAQVLATKSNFQTRRHYLNMRACIEALLGAGIIPVVNENDVVATTELMFTDNDELAGLLAGMVNADLLCLLSTVPGVYDGDPANPATKVIGRWDEQQHQAEDIVARGASALGRGGMHSKLDVARKTAKLGTEVVIADGSKPDIVSRILDGSEGTRFPVLGEVSPAKRWLASADDHATGSVTVNTGAETALLDANRLASLLPVGIESVEGNFKQGDVIQVLGSSGRVLGCGRAGYDHRETERVMGQRGHKPLIHYDYLYLVD
jgi:glutamate 5-kinase